MTVNATKVSIWRTHFPELEPRDCGDGLVCLVSTARADRSPRTAEGDNAQALGPAGASTSSRDGLRSITPTECC
jgi:hypothetical protein